MIDEQVLPSILERIAEEVESAYGQGNVVDYIPELQCIEPRQFGMAVRTISGAEYTVGAADKFFSIQSISKLFSLMLSLETVGDSIWQRVGREPSGMRFNSLLLLESEGGVPRNPFINAGAIVVTDSIVMRSSVPIKRIEEFIAKLSGNAANRVDQAVAKAEKNTGFLNAAIANLLKAKGNLYAEVGDTLDCYFKQCAIEMSCLDLARATYCLANPNNVCFHRSLCERSIEKQLNSLMLTCGLYDAVGNFAYHVGLPAKSGVGGGIVAISPKQYSVAVWSPELDSYGNSVLGQLALQKLAEYTQSSIF